MIIAAVNKAPLFVALKTPARTKDNNTKAVANNWAPVPIQAQNKLRLSGERKTSPLIIFQPVSSSVNSSYRSRLDADERNKEDAFGLKDMNINNFVLF